MAGTAPVQFSAIPSSLASAEGPPGGAGPRVEVPRQGSRQSEPRVSGAASVAVVVAVVEAGGAVRVALATAVAETARDLPRAAGVQALRPRKAGPKQRTIRSRMR